MANYGLAKVADTLGYAQPLVAGGTTLTFATGPNRIIRSAGSWFSAHPWAVGMVADVSGTGSNDGRYTVVAASALELEVAEVVVPEGPLSGGERVDGGFRPVFSVVRNGVFVDGPTEIDIPGSGLAGTPGAGLYQWEQGTNPPAIDGGFASYLGPAGIVLCLIVGHQILESTDDGATWSVALSLDTAAADFDQHCSPFVWVTGSDGRPYLCTGKQSRGENVFRFAIRDDAGWVTDSVANAQDGAGYELFPWKGLVFAGNRYAGLSIPYTYDPVTRSITSVLAFPNTPGTPQSFFFNLGQRLFRVNASSAASAQASANILTDVQANYTDGQTFTLTDNTRPRRTVTFEFDVLGNGVTPGNIQVDISADVTAEDVEAAIIAAIAAQRALGNLNITASNGGAGNVLLSQDCGGLGGNTAISTTGGPPGTFPAAFAGGTNGTMGLDEWQFGTWQQADGDFIPQMSTENATRMRSYVRFKLDDDSVLVFGQGNFFGNDPTPGTGMECFRLFLSGSTPTAERKTLQVVPVALRFPTTIGTPQSWLLVGYTDNTDPANPRRILWFYPTNVTRDLQWTKLELDPVDPANNPMTVLDTTQAFDGWTLPASYAGDGHQVWSPGGDFGVQILGHVRDALGLRVSYRVADDPGNPNKTVRLFYDTILGRPGNVPTGGQCRLVAGSAVGGGTVVEVSLGVFEVQNVDADPSITHEVVVDILADGIVDGSYPHFQAVANRP